MFQSLLYSYHWYFDCEVLLFIYHEATDIFTPFLVYFEEVFLLNYKFFYLRLVKDLLKTGQAVEQIGPLCSGYAQK